MIDRAVLVWRASTNRWTLAYKYDGTVFETPPFPDDFKGTVADYKRACKLLGPLMKGDG